MLVKQNCVLVGFFSASSLSISTIGNVNKWAFLLWFDFLSLPFVCLILRAGRFGVVKTQKDWVLQMVQVHLRWEHHLTQSTQFNETQKFRTKQTYRGNWIYHRLVCSILTLLILNWISIERLYLNRNCTTAWLILSISRNGTHFHHLR